MLPPVQLKAPPTTAGLLPSRLPPLILKFAMVMAPLPLKARVPLVTFTDAALREEEPVKDAVAPLTVNAPAPEILEPDPNPQDPNPQAPPLRLSVAPFAAVKAPVSVPPPLRLSVPPLTFTVPLLLNTSPNADVPDPAIVMVPLLIMVREPPLYCAVATPAVRLIVAPNRLLMTLPESL